MDSEAARVIVRRRQSDIVRRRQSDIGWSSQSIEGMEATIAFAEIDAVLTMAEICEDAGIA